MPARKTQRKRKKSAPVCPECGSTSVIPVVHGIITPAIRKTIDDGEAIHADREEWEGITEWYCKSCGCDWGPHLRRFKKRGSVNATNG